MRLKLHDGWVEEDDGSCILIYPPGESYLNVYAAVVPWDTAVDSYVVVYPHGKMHWKKPDLGGKRFKTVEEAHAYLLSPRVVCPMVPLPSAVCCKRNFSLICVLVPTPSWLIQTLIYAFLP